MLPEALARLDAFVAKQPEPQPSRPDAIRQLVDIGLAADAAVNERIAAQSPTPPAAMTQKTRKKLAAKKPYAAPAKHPRERAKELAVGAVKEALAKVDAPEDVKLERKRRLVAPPATGKIGKAR